MHRIFGRPGWNTTNANRAARVMDPRLAFGLFLVLGAAWFTDAAAQTSQNIVIDLSVLETLPPNGMQPAAPRATPGTVPQSRLEEGLAARLGLLPLPQPSPPPTTDIEIVEPDRAGVQPAPQPSLDVPTANADPRDDLPAPGLAGVADASVADPPVSPVAAAAAGDDNDGEAVTMALSVAFASGSAVLSDDYRDRLGELGTSMLEDETLRLRLKAYAAREDETELFARRLSLSRGLAVRTYLIGMGINQTRIPVQALGDDGGIADDRVDVYLVTR